MTISKRIVRKSQAPTGAVDLNVYRCSRYKMGTREMAATQDSVAAVMALSELRCSRVLQRARFEVSKTTKAAVRVYEETKSENVSLSYLGGLEV